MPRSTRDCSARAPPSSTSTRPPATSRRIGDGTIVRVNETFARWTGYAKAELVGVRRLQELLTVPGRIYFETHIAPLLRMQGEVSEIALDVRCRDGTVLPVLVNAVLRGASSDAPDGYRLTIFNATERRRYERELLHARRRAEDAARVKSDLLAMLGHDIRTPLERDHERGEAARGDPADARSSARSSTSSSARRRTCSSSSTTSWTTARLEAGRLPLEERVSRYARCSSSSTRTSRPRRRKRRAVRRTAPTTTCPMRSSAISVKICRGAHEPRRPTRSSSPSAAACASP